MALDPAFIGYTCAPIGPYTVGREKIREFADAIGAADPAYHDPGAALALGHPDVIAPPTFPILVSMPAYQALIDDPEFGLDYTRVVHGDQRFVYTRPIRAGDRLICVATVEDITTRAGHDFLTIRTNVTTEADEQIASVWTKLVVRGEG
jgi:acyl dehydratase